MLQMPELPPDAEVNWSLLSRYVAGDCTSGERVRVAAWIAEDPSREGTVASLRRIADAWAHELPEADRPGPGHHDTETRAAWQQMRARLSAGGAAGRQHRGLRNGLLAGTDDAGRLHRNWRGVGGGATWRVAAIAAAVVVALGVGLAAGFGRHRAGLGGAAGHEYATVAGQRLSVTLVDGTQLTLAPASRVRLPADYGRGPAGRELTLEGEAYFTVVHDPRKPFTVQAANAIIADVGTRFDVRSYTGDPAVRVVVVDGEVAVRAASRAVATPTAARPGDLARVTPSGAITVTHKVDVSTLRGWTTGQLTFSDTPLPTVIRDLERWYGLRIEIADPDLADRLVTAALGDASPANALDALAASLDARADRRGDTITLVHLNHAH